MHEAFEMAPPPSAPERVEECRTIGQIIRMAQERMPTTVRVYAESGAGEDVTRDRNLATMRHYALLPRVMRDVRSVDTSTEFLGMPLSMPVMLSPVGTLALFDDDGALASATAAVQEGIRTVVGCLASPAYDEVVEGSGSTQMFQVYVGGDRGWWRDLLAQLAEVGCAGLCITVDNPVRGQRDRVLEDGVDWKQQRKGLPPNYRAIGRDLQYQACFTWEELEWLRSETELPIMLKGVMHPDDAKAAAGIGVDAVYLSNHGGIEFDHVLTTMELLESVVQTVGDDCDVVLDSGFRRGSDVVKALALGARLVFLGRLQVWGLAAGGHAGVARMLQILHHEIATTMQQLGCTSISEITRDHVRAPLVP